MKDRIVPSAPTALEQARMRLWEMPASRNRAQYLERKDLEHELHQAECIDRKRLTKPGFAKIMDLAGQTREDIDDGM